MTPQLKKYTLLLLALWLGAGVASLCWNIYDNRQERDRQALHTAQVLLAGILDTTSWFSRHGEVYVPADTIQEIAPPRAEHSPKTAVSSQGRQLVSTNPATMLRELSEISEQRSGASYHITSLTPLNPWNTPRPWEVSWLQQLGDKSGERSETVEVNGTLLFRFMAPLHMETPCLTCHPRQSEKEGELRGAITITLPLEQSLPGLPLLLAHIGPMLAGSLLIILFSIRLAGRERRLLAANRQLNREIRERRETQARLQAARDQLEQRVEERTRELSRANRRLNRKIHQRAHIEEALITIYDEFYQLFNSAPDSMLVIDQHFEIMRVNRAFLELCGLPLNRIIGRKCHEIFFGTTCRTPSCPVRAILGGEQRIEIECEKAVLTMDKNIPCIITSTPFLEQDGSLIGAILVVTDISRRKKAEQELEESARKLKESNRALEDFAHSISHDLQEPLMLIEAFSRRLQKKSGDRLTRQCSAYVEQIHTASSRMRELINGLLLYSRVDSRDASFRPVELDDLLQEVLETLALQLEQSGSTITIDPLPTVFGDPLQLRQLFQNILGNAIKYRRPGVAHTIHIEDLGTETGPPPMTRLRVSDNGRGFNPEDGEHIFDIFKRLQTERDIEGTGIGLAICRKIVQRHRGRITATGKPGHGASFTLSLSLEN